MLAVVSPLAWKGIVAGFVLGFIFSLRELDTIVLIQSGNRTAMMKIYTWVHTAYEANVASLSLVLMGVRVDAKPFAWQDPASGSFLGFLVDLCTDAVTRAGYPFEQVPITAAERIEVLKGDRGDIDVLCDPTTITLSRMRAFAGLKPPGSVAFSPIVFVANGTYMTRTDLKGVREEAPGDDPEACLAPPVSEVDKASAATPAAGAAVKAASLKFLRAGYVVGTTIGPVM